MAEEMRLFPAARSRPTDATAGVAVVFATDAVDAVGAVNATVYAGGQVERPASLPGVKPSRVSVPLT